MNDYTPIVVADTANMIEDDWLEYRRKGVGGSDVAAIYGMSPFCTTRDLYYDKLGVKPAIKEEDNWVAKKYGHLLEDLVAEIFSFKTGIEVFQEKTLFAHPKYPFMQANVDYFATMPDGKKAILECKTSTPHCKDKWEDDSIPMNYELQVRHYMAVMNIDIGLIACLFGNNESEFVYRKIERDLDYEQDMIDMEENFWEEFIQKKVEPPYTEDGDLVLKSLCKHLGNVSDKETTRSLDKYYIKFINKYLELKDKKSELDKESKRLEGEMKKVYAPVVEEIGTAHSVLYVDSKKTIIATYKPQFRKSIN